MAIGNSVGRRKNPRNRRNQKSEKKTKRKRKLDRRAGGREKGKKSKCEEPL